jgi:hypothetical protein
MMLGWLVGASLPDACDGVSSATSTSTKLPHQQRNIEQVIIIIINNHDSQIEASWWSHAPDPL